MTFVEGRRDDYHLGEDGDYRSAVRLDVFMARANEAYYASRDPFADFTTSPEIAQVFGELLGAWAAVVWRLMDSPPDIALVEAGPGRGTLMQDILRCVRRVAPAFCKAAEVHFIETSARLQAEQASRVPTATWHRDLEDLPVGPCIVLANEFLDALPIRQFVKRTDGWRERYVQGSRFAELPVERPASDVPVGLVVEESEAASGWVFRLAQRLVQQGGVALIVDYGKVESGPGESFQALRGGKPADPLIAPGTADLTAHVDFGALARAARRGGAAVWGPLAQGIFLERLGLSARTAALCGKNPNRREELNEASDRLASPSRMGELFKVLCVSHPNFPVPPGFEI